jgi:hypothetical protein
MPSQNGKQQYANASYCSAIDELKEHADYHLDPVWINLSHSMDGTATTAIDEVTG